MSTPSPWISLATLMRPQGRRGELLAELQTDLRDLFREGMDVTLATSESPSAEAAPTKLESFFFPTGRNAGRIVLKLAGVDSIDAAEKLGRLHVLIPTAQLPELEAGTYFVRDLLGCTLYDGDSAVGEIVDVEFPTTPDGRTRLEDAAPLLVVEIANQQPSAEDEDVTEVLIPLINAWTREADLAHKRFVMELPAGLLDEA